MTVAIKMLDVCISQACRRRHGAGGRRHKRALSLGRPPHAAVEAQFELIDDILGSPTAMMMIAIAMKGRRRRLLSRRSFRAIDAAPRRIFQRSEHIAP